MTGTFKKLFTAILAIVMVAALLLGCVACAPADKGGDTNTGDTNTGDTGNNEEIVDKYAGMTDAEYAQALTIESLGVAVDALTTYVGAYKNMASFSKGNYGATAEMDLMLGDMIIDLIEQAVFGTTDSGLDMSFLSKIGLDMVFDSTADMAQTSVALGLSDTEIVKLLLMVSEESVWVGAPDLAEAFLQLDFADLGVAINTTSPAVMGLMDAIPSEEQLTAIVNRYLAIILKEIDQVERTTETLTLDGLSQEATKLTLKIYEQDVWDAIEAFLTALKADAEIKAIIDKFGTYYNDMMAESYAEMDMEWTDQDIYAELIEIIDNALENMPTEPTDTETYIALTLYVDGSHKVIGFNLTVPEEDATAVNAYTVTENNAIATLVEIPDAMLYITGKGTTADGVISGNYTINIDKITFLNVELKNFDLTNKDAISGTVILKPTADLLMQMFGSSTPMDIANVALEVKMDITKDKQDVELKLIGDGALVLGLALKSATKAPAALQAPTNTVDATDDAAVMDWASGINFDGVLDNLTKAGVPAALVTALENMLSAA